MKRRIFLVSLLLLLLWYNGNTPALVLNNTHPNISQLHPLPKVHVPLMPLPIASSSAVTAQSYIIVDTASNTVIGGKNIYQKRSPASLVKLAGALVAREIHTPETLYRVKNPITEEVTLGLQKGQELTQRNLLYASLVSSANDAAQAIADNYPGGSQQFVSAMNALARTIVMRNTRFTNAIGFDIGNQYSTAYDLSRLAIRAMEDPLITHIVGTSSVTVPDAQFRQFYPLFSSNELLGSVPGINGIKTGKTDLAGENLISSYLLNGEHQLVIVVLGSLQRFEDTRSLVDSLSSVSYVPFPVYEGSTAGR